jgi:RNA polymerase sigma-70 factor (ECF subfamily)
MIIKRIKDDKIFAQKVCKEILAGNQNAINDMHKRYQALLMGLAEQYLSEPSYIEELFAEFWDELSAGESICKYSKNKTGQSLKAFFIKILIPKIHRKGDKAKADKICSEVRVGNQEAVNPLIEKYDNDLKQRAKRKLYSYDPDPHRTEEVVNNVWIAILGKDKKGEYRICKYNGTSTLKTYLISFLDNHIANEIRKIRKEETENNDEDGSEFPDKKHKELREIIDRLLAQLEKAAPNDAKLIRMYLEGLNFKEMATELLPADATEEEINQKYSAVRKQFTRPRTGSMAKFRILLNRLMEKEGLTYENLLEDVTFI